MVDNSSSANTFEVYSKENSSNIPELVVTYSDSSPSPSPSLPGDVDGDSDVDIFDYNTLISNFGTNYPQADFNNNGTVDIFDYNTVISNFGT